MPKWPTLAPGSTIEFNTPTENVHGQGTQATQQAQPPREAMPHVQGPPREALHQPGHQAAPSAQRTPRRPHEPLTTPTADTTPPGAPATSVAGAPSSSVHRLETTAHPSRSTGTSASTLPSTTRTQDRLHGPHARDRGAIIAALAISPNEHQQRRLDRLCRCCAFPTFRATKSHDVILSLDRCRDRLCPLCQRTRSARVSSRLQEWTQGFKATRLITLTTRSRASDLAPQLDAIMAAFRELRRTLLWRQHVPRGAWSLEVTFNRDTRCWHPHIHIVADGEYLPQPKLKAAWHRITRSSFIVDIRLIVDRAAAARYVAKYISKSTDLGSWDSETILHFADAMHGRRLFGTFGPRPPANPDPADIDKITPLTTPLVGFNRLEHEARKGNANAIRAMVLMQRVAWMPVHMVPKWISEHEQPTGPVTTHERQLFCELCLAVRDGLRPRRTPVKPDRPIDPGLSLLPATPDRPPDAQRYR